MAAQDKPVIVINVFDKVEEMLKFGLQHEMDMDCSECPISSHELVNCHGCKCHYALIKAIAHELGLVKEG